VVVNASFATRFFADQEPLGGRLHEADDAPWLTIVGVVPDLWMWDIESQDEHPAGYYVPLAQHPTPGLAVAVRHSSAPGSILPTMREVVGRIDPTTPLFEARRSTMPSRMRPGRTASSAPCSSRSALAPCR